MKPLDNRCTISFKHGQVNNVVSQQFILGHSATAKSNESSGDELSIGCGSGTPENITAC